MRKRMFSLQKTKQRQMLGDVICRSYISTLVSTRKASLSKFRVLLRKNEGVSGSDGGEGASKDKWKDEVKGVGGGRVSNLDRLHCTKCKTEGGLAPSPF